MRCGKVTTSSRSRKMNRQRKKLVITSQSVSKEPPWEPPVAAAVAAQTNMVYRGHTRAEYSSVCTEGSSRYTIQRCYSASTAVLVEYM